MFPHSDLSRVALIALLAGVARVVTGAQHLPYPPAPASDQVDTYGSEKVADPFRPLEDDRSVATTAWVKAENRLTEEYLSRIPYRAELKDRLRHLLDYPKYTLPAHKGPYFFFTKNEGLQNQAVVYVQKGLDAQPRRLLDPNTLSKDGTSRVLQLAPSKNGKYLAYAVSAGGSDWEQAYVLDVETGKALSDHLQWLKVGQISWAGNGFFYSRYDAPQSGHELSSKNEDHKVYFHRVGSEQSKDELVYQDQQHPLRFHVVQTTPDERFAILTIQEASSGKDGNALYFRDLSKPDTKFTGIVEEISNDRYEVVTDSDSGFIIETNAHAPNSRLAFYNLSHAGERWTDLIAEKPEPLENVRFAGGKLFVTYTKDVASRAYVYGLDGKLQGEIKLPGLGTVQGFEGEPADAAVFYMFTSFTVPPTIYRYEISSQTSQLFRSADVPSFDSGRYETKQVFYQSKDGTRIPMFLVYRKGLQRDGRNPTLLYAYGGFNISVPPVFSATRLALLEQGFVFASANLRGGGEYGEAWHRAGIKQHKQNVFDDYIGAAEWLIQNRYTTSARLAIHGVSNGGLLVGATINQRPELFRAAIAQAGVMDMLRFQKFTIGWNWIADYGSSDNPAEFAALRAYSPIHNIRAGVKYPATLITTADHDDRVVPGHSFKYAATLQQKASPENPVLIRIDTNSGHGPSSTTKTIEQTADLYSFLFYNLGITPTFAHSSID